MDVIQRYAEKNIHTYQFLTYNLTYAVYLEAITKRKLN